MGWFININSSQEDSLCEKEFLRVGLTFWTGEEAGSSLDSHTAASVGDLEFISQLAHSELDLSNWSGWTPLMYGCYHGHRALVTRLLDWDCKVTRTNNKGRSGKTLSRD